MLKNWFGKTKEKIETVVVDAGNTLGKCSKDISDVVNNGGDSVIEAADSIKLMGVIGSLYFGIKIIKEIAGSGHKSDQIIYVVSSLKDLQK